MTKPRSEFAKKSLNLVSKVINSIDEQQSPATAEQSGNEPLPRGIHQHSYETWESSLRSLHPSVFDEPETVEAKAFQRFLEFKKDYDLVTEATFIEWLMHNTDANDKVTLNAEQERRYRNGTIELLSASGELIAEVGLSPQSQATVSAAEPRDDAACLDDKPKEPMITSSTPGDTDISLNAPFWWGGTRQGGSLRDDAVPLTADQVELYRNHLIRLLGPDGEVVDVIGGAAGDNSERDDELEDGLRLLRLLECLIANQHRGLELDADATAGLSDAIMYARNLMEPLRLDM